LNDTAAPPAGDSIAGALDGLLDDLRGALGERVELLSLELGAAVDAAVRIVVLLVASAIVAVTAWLALWAVAVGLLVEAGWAWAWALLAVAVVNVVATLLALRHARRLLPRLGMPATRRQLSMATSLPATRSPA
jgi:hypothetical protein